MFRWLPMDIDVRSWLVGFLRCFIGGRGLGVLVLELGRGEVSCLIRLLLSFWFYILIV